MPPEPKSRRYGQRKRQRPPKKNLLSTETAQALKRAQDKWGPLLTRVMSERTVEGQVRILTSIYKISRAAGKGVWGALLARWSQKTGTYLTEQAYAEFRKKQK